MLKLMNRSDFDKVYDIIEKSFPVDERRSRENQRRLLDKEYYKIFVIQKDCIIGFIAVYELKNFVFAEHFAVDEKYRGKSTGSQMLTEIKEIYGKMIVLEVERPESPIACRRIEFYKRNGFFLNEYDYIQPALGEDRKPIPLYIMSTQAPLEQNEFESTKTEIYSKVYGR